MAQMTAIPEWLRIAPQRGAEGLVDRENNVIRSVIAAEEGPFKSRGRGEFDKAGIRQIVRLAKESRKGLRAHWNHETASSTNLGRYLGRFRNPVNAVVMREVAPGSFEERAAAKMDLYFDPTAMEPPPNGGGKPLGEYVMDLASSDSEAFGTSLVLKVDKNYRLDSKGVKLKDEKGEDLPPLWMPTELMGLDVVATGDATNSFLSADEGELLDGLPMSAVHQAVAMLDQQFGDAPRDVVQKRVLAWLDRYLDWRFGGDPEPAAGVLSLEDMSRAAGVLALENKRRALRLLEVS